MDDALPTGADRGHARVTELVRAAETKYREFVEGVADVILELALDGTITYCNPSSLALSGWTPDELIGKSAFDLAVEADHPLLKAALAGTAATLMSPKEYRIRTKSGDAKWVRVHMRPVMERGAVVGLRGVMSDIDEWVRSREELLSQKLFAESLIETAQILVLILDPAGRIQRYNECVERLTGSALERVKGGEWAGLFVPEQQRDAARGLFAVAPAGTHSRRGVVPVTSSGGELRTVEWQTRNLFDSAGRITGVLATGMDITDAARAAEALRESEAKYRAIFENLHDTYFKTDLTDTIIMASPSGERIFGYKVDEAIGQNLSAFYVDLRKRDEVLKMLSEKGYVREFEAQLRRRDGSIIWVSSNTTFWFDKNGSIGGVEGITRDITERKRAEEEKAALEEQLRQAQKMEAIGTLAGGIAHDFNNLLTSIMGCANMLKTSMSERDKGFSAVDVIERAAARASELTKQLLGFARKGKLKNVPVDLHKVVGDSVAILGRTIDRRIAIEQKLAPGRPIVMGDGTQLQQVVMNLIVNARDAMPGGGRIEVETRVQTFDEEQCKKHSELAPGEYLLVSVADTGCGIPDEIRDRIFEPFFTTKPIGVGTGMGLAMVYGIVKNHGGSVGLETAEGSGTTFTVYLPLCASGALPREEPTVAGAHRGSGRILVVDDEDTVRETVQMMLSMLGYEVDTAADGLEAIEQFKKHAGQTRLVILDMTMPKMNGSECFRELRKIDPNVRVLLSTGHAIEGAAQDLLESGIAGLVQKPYIAQQLAQAIAEALA